MVKAVELVREIRDKNFIESKSLPVDEQIRLVEKKSKELLKGLFVKGSSTAGQSNK